MLYMPIEILIERCQQGDADALGQLYRTYARQMRGVCRHYVSDEQTVQDVLHDAFVIIFTSFDRLRDVQRAEAWMMAITRNVALKCKERQTSVKRVPLEEAALVSQPAGTTDVRGVPLDEVVRMIDRLPEGYGQVFRLSVFEGLSHKEIAAMLGIEPHSSSSQLSRAKKLLRKMMRHYWTAGLLLLIPIALFLLRKEQTTVVDEGKPVVTKHMKTPVRKKAAEPQPEPVSVRPIATHAALAVAEPQPTATVMTADAIMVDILSDAIAQEPTVPDTTAADTTATSRPIERPHFHIADLLPSQPAIGTRHQQKWSLQLAFAGLPSEQNRYNQPYSYKPYIDPDVQQSPSELPSYVIPSRIDNWTDYAIYLASTPNATSAQTRSMVMRIALNNACRPGDDKILRSSHHRMPATWSLAMKYKLTDRFGLETGLGYSRLSSLFETGAADGPATEGEAQLGKNAIREQQTIHYLGIPMKGIYQLYDAKRWGLYGDFGLTVDIPVRSTLHADYYVNGLYEGGENNTFRAPWQFATTLGLGLQYHLTSHIGLFVEPGLQYYLPTQNDIETYHTEHPFTFSLPLGLRFSW